MGGRARSTPMAITVTMATGKMHPRSAMNLSRTFTKALAFATERHANQKRKGSDVPYVAHLLAVTALVLDYGGTEAEAIAALLHDCVEDQKAKIDEIRERFGAPVADIVSGCSDTDEDPKPPWRPRKEAFIAGLSLLPAAVRLVVAADKLQEGARGFRRVAVAAGSGRLTPPCGACRQMLWEFCGDIEVLLVNLDGESERLRLKDIFPRPFDVSFIR